MSTAQNICQQKCVYQQKNLHQLFEQQVEKTPDNVALLFAEQSVSYVQLNQRANQLAAQIRLLHGEKILPDTLIALYFDRSVEMVTAILAVLKVGAAYVPVSPDTPQTRTRYILEDTSTPLVLIQDKFKSCLDDWLGYQVLVVAQDLDETSLVSNQPSMSEPHHLAYVIYTSGTTGQPKGVEIEHRSVVNLIDGQSKTFGFSEHEVVAWIAAYTFDASVEQLFLALLNGASLFIPDAAQINAVARLKQSAINLKVTHLHATPGYLSVLGAFPDGHALKRVISGGDVVDAQLKRLWQDKLINEYGPTENTVTAVQCLDYNSQPGIGCIGKPVNKTRVYVLSEDKKPVPTGTVGELYIGGAGVARGYHNLPELTTERFIKDSFVDDPDARMYQTGDLGRWLDNGNLEYLGRNDQQVKIRGFRIELTEISTALTDIPQIKQAVVISRQRAKNRYLAAYFVTQPNYIVDAAALKQQLATRLPHYMLPSTFTCLQAIPLTVNGKLDRQLLPEPEHVSSAEYVAPQDQLESQLCDIWQQVLARGPIGVDDNFFEMGGDSIGAITMTALVDETLDVEVPLGILFERPTISGLAGHLRKTNHKQDKQVIPRRAMTHYPLTSAQQGLLYIEHLQAGTDAYHLPHLFKLNNTDVPTLQAAINVVVDRHPVLNSVYLTECDGRGYQRALMQNITIQNRYCSANQLLLAQVKKDISQPFELSVQPSLKLYHYIVTPGDTGSTEDETHYLLMLFHHIGFDGWSTDVFFRELATVYQALCDDCPADLPALDISYGDYALWQSGQLQGDNLAHLHSYWQQQLTGVETLVLATDFPRPDKPDYRGRDVHFALDESLSSQLRRLASSQQTTLYTVLLSGFYVTLAAMSGQSDIVVGTPSDNRSHGQTQNLVGLFVNALALRAQVDGAQSVGALINQVHGIVTQGKVHQALPFEKVVEYLGIAGDPSRHPVFQVMFTVQNFFEGKGETADKPLMDKLGFEPAKLCAEHALHKIYSPAKFDLSLFLSDEQNQIFGVLNYALSLFNSRSVTRIIDMYRRVLQAFVDSEKQIELLQDIDLLSPLERQCLLHKWCGTEHKYPDKTLHGLFEQQAEKTPDNTALLFDRYELSYRQLNQKANRLARAIVACLKGCSGGGGGPIYIALYLERSMDMVVAMLAVLKAGAVYVPISPKYPRQRVQFMLEDSASALIVTDGQYQQVLCEHFDRYSEDEGILLLDNVNGHSSENLCLKGAGEDLAYVLYTSGTTGKPKGVLTPHRGVVSLLHRNVELQLSEKDVLLQLSDPSFDAATFEIWGALLHGAKLVIAQPGQDHRARVFGEVLNKHRINVLWLTKSLFDVLYLSQPDLFEHLRCLIVGGETLNPALIRQLVAAEKRPKAIFNGYGPTESTTFTTLWPCKTFTGKVPLGKATNNRQLYVLDKQLKLVPIGCPGELYIGGAGLAVGYLNRPELTARCFMPNPFVSAPDARVYKSGDRVRWLPDGNLEYLGRVDNQVKIRGFRIEPEEVQEILINLVEIKQAAVIDQQGPIGRYLAAYVVMQPGQTFDAARLSTRMSACSPDYMVPATFTSLAAIPLTANGKLNRAALAKPELTSVADYVAPTGPVEQQLCTIWEKVLGVKTIGIEDNFYRSGGSSIKASIMAAMIAREMGFDVPVSLLFAHPSVAALAGQLKDCKRIRQGVAISTKKQAHQQHHHYPLSFSQERLLFIESFEQGCDAYHIPYLVKLKQADIRVLQAAFIAVTERHPVLKTVYLHSTNEGNYQQVLDKKVWISGQPVADKTQLLQALRADISRSFDLSAEPALKLHHYCLTNPVSGFADDHLLMLFHHIAFDGWSTDIFMKELLVAYQALSAGGEPFLPELAISYGDFAQWQREQLQGETLERLIKYWSGQLTGFESLVLATDHARPVIPNYRGSDYRFELDEQLSVQLRELARLNKTSLFTVMLSGFYVTLAVMSGQTDIVVGTPADNRHHYQTHNLIGFFVNSLALRVKVDEARTINDLIADVHQIITQAKAHEALPFEKLVEVLKVERDTSRHPIYQVMFSVQHFFQSSDDSEVMAKLPFEPTDLLSSHSVYNPAKFDLSVFLNDGETRITGVFNYATSLFDETTVVRLLDVYLRILQASVDGEQQSRRIGQIDVLSAQEKQALLKNNHRADTRHPQKTFAQMFEAQVAKTPKAPALTFEKQSLNYQQLNDKANQLAHAIRAAYRLKMNRPLVADTLVGLYLYRSIETVITILAVLKAGGAYVPIATDVPDNTVAFMLDDIKTPIVLTVQRHKGSLDSCIERSTMSPMVLLVDDTSLASRFPATNPLPVSGPEDLAYIIYTSGTTGYPKGVMINQGVYAGFIHEAAAYLADSLGCGKISTLGLTQYTFDIFGLEYGVTLATGGLLVLSQISTVAEDLSRHQSGINFIQQTPSLWQLLLQDPDFAAVDQTVLNKIQIMVGGESGSLDLFETLDGLFGKVHQVYGPTETCIWSTRCVYQNQRQKTIGTPFPGEQVYVLSASLQLKPVGAPGDLYIGGAGLARGYFNRDELTAAVFINNPFDGGKTRLFKTGDRGRRQADGQLVFLGRDDSQIKMRGYRIELGEIERVVNDHPDVNAAAVIFDRNPDNPRILAFVTLDNPSEHSRGLRDWLKGHLPGYMVPAHVTVLDRFELNASGKIDRKTLKLPSAAVSLERSPTLGVNALEQQIARIWQALLQLEHVATDQTFFDLGGHSLLMNALKKRLDAELGLTVTLVELFQYPTIERLAAYLQRQTDSKTTKPTQSAASQSTKQDIAIIGMAGRFPGAADVDEFWQKIRDGESMIHHYDQQQLLAQGIDQKQLKDPDYVLKGGRLVDCDLFDADFFGYSPFEAQLIDPQQRLFLEMAWTGIEHAGYDVQRLDLPVGVFAGVGNLSYLHHYLMNNPEVVARQGEYKLMISNEKDYLPLRVAYKLGLTGPAVNVATACSSSLVALHMACQSLRQGECDMALAGGAAVRFPQQGYLYQQGMITSPDGCCRAFDADAQGTVAGAGVGLVVLTPLSRALAQRNTIYAVVKGSAVNNDGTDKAGFTAPSVNGQAAVIIDAMTGLDFESISYIEAHGTATPMGDPVEVAALTQAYRRQTDKTAYCAIGSVKTNIGHLDVAAGIAGVIKTVQALRHRQLPPSLHFNRPNPNIDFAGSPFYVNRDLAKWTGEAPLRAGVSSFGIGGTNSHIVLQQAPPDDTNTVAEVASKQWQLLCLSAKTESSLTRASENLLAHLRQHPSQPLADMAYTLHMGRQQFDHRRFMVCQDNPQSPDGCFSLAMNKRNTRHVAGRKNQVVFMFPGQGAQYAGMGAGLYQHEPLYKTIVDQCAEILEPELGLDLAALLYRQNDETANQQLAATRLAQPALFVTEYALARLLLSWGINPVAMIGHSIGEYVAATLAGVFSLDDALKLVAARGRLMQSMSPGDMVVVGLSAEQIEILLFEGKVEGVVVAAQNAPNQSVVSGSSPAVAECIAVLKNQLEPVMFKRLHISHAFHSPMMNGVIPEFCRLLQQLTLNPPDRPCLSNLDGLWLTAQQATSPQYWCDHLLKAVRFCDGIKTLLSAEQYPADELIFVEVGPGRALSAMVRQHSATTVFNGMRVATQNEPDQRFLLNTLGQLWLHNVAVDWSAFYAGQLRRRVAMPTYAFDSVKHWVDPVKKPAPAVIETQTGSGPTIQPEKQWLSAPSWVSVCNVGKGQHSALFDSALLFVTKAQANAFDFAGLSGSVSVIVLDESVTDIHQAQSNYFRLNPTIESGYQALMHCSLANQRFNAIIHMASADQTLKATDPLDHGFYSLFMIKHQLLPNLDIEHLLVLTSQLAQISNQNSINSFNGAMVGGIRNINHRYPHINGLVIDVGDTLTVPASESQAESQSKVKVDFSFLSLILNQSEFYQCDDLLAVKYGKLWRQQHQPINPEVDAHPLIEDDDTLLITDGLGGIGLAIAKHISARHTVNFVLLHSNGEAHPGPDIIEQHSIIEQLSANCCQVDIRQLDIADSAQVKQLIENLEAKYPGIDGIIHTKGVMPVSVAEHTLEKEKNSFGGKVYGINNLLKNIDLANLKFLANSSSLASIIGHVHRIEYCAANSYLDYLSADRLLFKNTRVVTINWPGWSDGASDKPQAPSQTGKDCGYSKFNSLRQANAVAEREGAGLFYQLIHQGGYEQVIVSKLDIQVLKAQLFNGKPFAGPNSLDNPGDNHNWTLLDEYYSDREYQTAAAFHAILGVDEIGVDDDFFKLGGNSLLAVQLMNKLKEIGINCDMQSIINGDTIKGIAQKTRSKAVNDIIVPLKTKPTNRKNVFFIHPVGGTVMIYKPITDKLNDSYNYYGIQNINIYHQQLLKADSLEALASCYIKAIMNIQPDEEYRLVGSSLGGTLAYEMACQMAAMGKKVEFVAMLDSWAGYSAAFKDKQRFEADMKRQQRQYNKMLGDIDENSRATMLEASWGLMQLLTAYHPGLSALPVHLYKANHIDEKHGTIDNLPDNGWQQYISKEMTVHLIEGDHVGIHQGQGLLQICTHLNRHLEVELA